MEGDLAIVSARLADDLGASAGKTYLYQRDLGGTDAWGELEQVFAADGSAGDQFGTAVAASANTFVATAPLDDDSGTSSGSAYVFDLTFDDDGDGVVDGNDVCPGTVIPEGVPTKRLGVNRWALVDGDGVFDTTPPPGGGNGPGLSFTIADTGGCSCEQIIEALDLGKGHTKFGCSTSAMETWVSLVNP